MFIELMMPVVTSVPPGLGHVQVATGSVVHRKPSPLFFFGLFVFYIGVYRVHHEKSGLRKHNLESRLLGEISITSDMQITPPLWQKVKKNQRAS